MRKANFFAVFVGIESPDPADAGAHQEEAEHQAQSGRQRPQDLRRRHVRDRGLHRRLRQRKGLHRRRHGGPHRRRRNPCRHGWPALCPAEHPAHAAAGDGRPAACRPRPLDRREPATNARSVSTSRRCGRSAISCSTIGASWSVSTTPRPTPAGSTASRRMLDCSGRPRSWRKATGGATLSRSISCTALSAAPEARERSGRCSRTAAAANPGALRHIMSLMALYVHLGPFSRFVIDRNRSPYRGDRLHLAVSGRKQGRDRCSSRHG